MIPFSGVPENRYRRVQARNQGGEAPPAKICRLPWKNVQDVVKIIGHSLKNLGPSENSSSPLVSQASYWPGLVLAVIINPSIIIFQSFFVIFPWSHDLKKVTSLSIWLDVSRTPRV